MKYKYTDQRLIETAKKFLTRKEWKKFDGNKQYQIAKLRGLLSECTAHMQDQRTIKKYTNEEILIKAKQFKNSTEWKQKDKKTYCCACGRGLLPKCTAHMERLPGIYDGIYKVYAYEFSNRCAYVGLTCNWKRRHESHAKDGLVFEMARSLHESPTLKLLEEKIPSPADAAERERYWIDLYKKTGWTTINVAKGGSIGNVSANKWTKEDCLISAKNSMTKSEWYHRDRNAYKAATQNRWFEEVTAHMVPARPPITAELIQKVAAKYTEVGKFSKENPSLYTVARRMGILLEVTKHMTRKRNDPFKR
jgi:hypothetical protein